MTNEDFAPLTQKEIDALWEELQKDFPFYSCTPTRWHGSDDYTERKSMPSEQYWEWNATAIMIVLAANDALDTEE